MRKSLKLVSAIGLLAAAAGVYAQQGVAPAKAEDAIRYRQSSLFVMNQHFGQIAAMVRGDRPFDAAVATSHAETVDRMGHLPWDAFFVTGANQGGNTRAKPEVFTQRDKFMEGAKRLNGETAKLVAATKSGDAGAVRTAFGGVGAACKACHEPYRAQ